MATERKVPQGRLSRLALLATVGARTGVGLLSRDGSRAAEQTAEVLGRMRGLAAKVGQIASYVDGVIPEGKNKESYQRALASLRDNAMTSPFKEVRATVEAELGRPLDQLFESFEEVPFASASIGQVHRAVLDGRQVAVKVQHKGISQAVESDLKTASMLEPIANLVGGKKANAKALLGEMATRLREELDYELERTRQEHFRKVHAGDPKIRIPAVIAERSTRRVLTTELAFGASLEQVSLGSEDERRAFAQTLWRFVFKGNLVGKMFNADPHPGNYLFGQHGVVTFLDFGCVEPIEEGRWKNALGLHTAALQRDEAGFARYASLLLKTQGGQWEKLAVGFSRACFEPIFAAPYRITRPYAAGLVGQMKEIGKQVRKMEDGNFVPPPRGMLFMNRLQFGFYSVLARLDVEADYAQVEREFLREAGLL